MGCMTIDLLNLGKGITIVKITLIIVRYLISPIFINWNNCTTFNEIMYRFYLFYKIKF